MNTGDRRSRRSCPRAYFYCKAVANRPFPDALRFPRACRPCQQGGTCILPNCASLTADAGSFSKPCYKGGVIFPWARHPPRVADLPPTSGFLPDRHRSSPCLRQGTLPLVWSCLAQVFTCGSARVQAVAAACTLSRPCSNLPPPSSSSSCDRAGTSSAPCLAASRRLLLDHHRRSIHAHQRHSFASFFLLRQHTNAAPAMMRGLSNPCVSLIPARPCPHASSAWPSRRKEDGRLIRGNR